MSDNGADVNVLDRPNQTTKKTSPRCVRQGFRMRQSVEAGEIATQFSLSNRLSKAFGWKVSREDYQL